MENLELQTHTFAPIFQSDAQILILGSFPSVQSRRQAFYYGHPQNRFWRVVAEVLNEQVPNDVEEKKILLYKHKIALWDVIHQCEIRGSSDQSIQNVKPNDLSVILSNAPIGHIYTNGQKAGKLYQKYFQTEIQCEMTILPSTSPANATYSLEKLVQAWRVIGNI